MIEIIREEDWDETKEKTLPKDIRQIGKPDIGDRIYIENGVYQYLHPEDCLHEKTAYALLGRFENCQGRQCTFVQAAMELTEITFDGELPVWSDHIWAYIYKRLKDEYDSTVIVGWALDNRGQLPDMTQRIEAFHRTHFGGVHQTLFLMNTLENEEAFYSSRNGRLYRRDGFYIYYDSSVPACPKRETALQKAASAPETPAADEREEQAAAAEAEFKHTASAAGKDLELEEQIYFEESKEPEPENNPIKSFQARRQGNYRKQLTEKEEQQKTPIYSSTLVLAAVICVLGFVAYQNHQKMNEMENALAQMNGIHTVVSTEQAQDAASDAVKVENVAGNVEKQTENSGGTQSSETEAASDVAAETTAADGSEVSEEKAAASETGEMQDTAAVEPQDAAAAEPRDAAAAETQGSAAVEAQDAATVGYLEQGYYIVQKGDSLASICRKIYQTTAMMDKICEINGIDDPDSIYAGQYLTLPN